MRNRQRVNPFSGKIESNYVSPADIKVERYVRRPDHVVIESRVAYETIWFGPIGGLIPRSDSMTVVNVADHTLCEFVNVDRQGFDMPEGQEWSVQTYVIPSMCYGKGLDADMSASRVFGLFLDKPELFGAPSEDSVSDEHVMSEYMCYAVVPPRIDNETL